LIVTTVRLAIQTQFFSQITFWVYFLSVGIYFLYLMFECLFVTGIFLTDFYWIIYNLMGTTWFWLSMTLVPASALLPAYLYKMAQITFYPTISHRVQHEFKEAEKEKKKNRRRAASKADSLTPDAVTERRNRWIRNDTGVDYDIGPNPNRVIAGEIKLTKSAKTSLNVVRAASKLRFGAKLRKSERESAESATDAPASPPLTGAKGVGEFI